MDPVELLAVLIDPLDDGIASSDQLPAREFAAWTERMDADGAIVAIEVMEEYGLTFLPALKREDSSVGNPTSRLPRL